MRRRAGSIAWALAWAVSTATHASDFARPVNSSGNYRPAPRISVNSTVPTNVSAPGVALPLIPAGPKLALDAALNQNLANPVPIAAIGMQPGYFAPMGAASPASASQPGQPAASAATARPGLEGAAESPASSFASGQRLADASQSNSGAPVEDVSKLVFDGVQTPSASGPVSVPDAGYLAGAQGKSGAALLSALHDISGRGHQVHEYDDARRYMFSTADQVIVTGQAGLVDAYSGIFVPGKGGNGADYPERGDQNHDGWIDRMGMNAEHLWPQSFFDKRLPMRSDLHHLMATFIHPNGIRSNLPFGEVRGRGSYQNDAGAKLGGGEFEPPNAVKGRVARSLLYFYTRYYDRNISNGAFGENFWNAKLEMLLRWNRDFPPTDQERRRNDLVEAFQGNRNPFVDDPGLADRVGAAAFRRGRPGRGFVARRR